MPHRLPTASESRALLALYHKGPLKKTQLSNLEAISSSMSSSALDGLLEKTLIEVNDRIYSLTAAGRDLCEVCLRYDLMVEANYHSDKLTREINRRSQVIEAVFSEVCRDVQPQATPYVPSSVTQVEHISPPLEQAYTPIIDAPACPSMSCSMAAQTAGSFGTGASPAPLHKTAAVPKPVTKPARPVIPPPRLYSAGTRK